MMIFFRTKILLAVSLISFLTACHTTYKIIPKETTYKENIIFSISKISENHNLNDGYATFNAPSGHKFVVLHMDIKNHSQTLQDVDFKEFYLLDENKTKAYRAEWILMTAFSLNQRAKFKKTLKPNENILRRIAYYYPKEQNPKILSIHGKSIELKRDLTNP